MDQLVVGTCIVLQNLLSLSLAFQMSYLIIKRIKWILNLTEPEQEKEKKMSTSILISHRIVLKYVLIKLSFNKLSSLNDLFLLINGK